MAISSLVWKSGHNARTISTAGTTSQLYGVTFNCTSGRWYTIILRAKGTNTAIVSAYKVQASGSSISYDHAASNLEMLQGLSGASRSGTSDLKALYYIFVSEYIGDPDSGGTLQGSASTSDGVATITVRWTNPNISDYDLDAGGNVVMSWTRPSSSSSGLRARARVYVNGTLCITRTGFTTHTGLAYTPSGVEAGNMDTAMGGVSPGVLKGRVETGFNFSTGVVYLDSSPMRIRVQLLKM